jgi:hypothetical protein
MKIITNSIKLIIPTSFFLAGFIMFYTGMAEYLYQRVLMSNNPTTFFPCEAFKEQAFLEDILSDNTEIKVIELTKYLSQNNGDLTINNLGSRCPGKYQFIASFGGEKQRMEIEKILEDQTIKGIHVFLNNQ